jgi:hypothetical protein
VSPRGSLAAEREVLHVAEDPSTANLDKDLLRLVRNQIGYLRHPTVVPLTRYEARWLLRHVLTPQRLSASRGGWLTVVRHKLTEALVRAGPVAEHDVVHLVLPRYCIDQLTEGRFALQDPAPGDGVLAPHPSFLVAQTAEEAEELRRLGEHVADEAQPLYPPTAPIEPIPPPMAVVVQARMLVERIGPEAILRGWLPPPTR